MQTYAYGYPRLGENREFKRLIEGYWQGKVSEAELRDGLNTLEQRRLATYTQFVDAYPIGEMTLYDNMLDTAIMLGVYPIDPNDLDAYFNVGTRRGRPADDQVVQHELPLPRGAHRCADHLPPALE
jgi:5-methyltetrahydropteroyltriglutamate--homocysteine methyltransferase